MFQFTEEELSLSPGMSDVLLPSHALANLKAAASSTPQPQSQGLQTLTSNNGGDISDDAQVHTIVGVVGVVDSSM